MKFSDWTPIIVSLVTLIGVLVVPALSASRPRQQLEALRAVRAGIEETDDQQVEADLRLAERGLADSIKARYSMAALELRRVTILIVTTIVLSSVSSVLISVVPDDESRLSAGLRVGAWGIQGLSWLLLLMMTVPIAVAYFRKRRVRGGAAGREDRLPSPGR